MASHSFKASRSSRSMASTADIEMEQGRPPFPPTVAFARRTSSGRYVNLSRDDLDSELGTGDYANYTVHLPPTPDNQPMEPSISSRVEEQYVSNSLFTGGFNSITRAHLMDKVIESEANHPQMAGSKGSSCAVPGCDSKVICDERGVDILPCECDFKICRDCFLDAVKSGEAVCPGCKEPYKVTDLDELNMDTRQPLPLPPGMSKMERRLSRLSFITMVFGSKRSDDQEAGDGASVNSARQGEPTERTRLLPAADAGYLDPNDPAVSPLNLWSVRAVRFFTILFLVLTFIWWLLLFISIFITPPYFNTRGSGFFDFAFTTLTAGNLLNLIIFFTTPSAAQQASSLALSVILFVDMILIVAVTQIRHEEGWVGITSVVWALFISIWAIVVDRTVQWGKQEEEERLTGRVESRRTLGEWLSVFSSSLLGIVFIAITVLFTSVLILRARDASLAAPGEKYWVDSHKYQVHLHCAGEKTTIGNKTVPTVLVEGGEGPVEHTLLPFIAGTVANGTVSRYCYWDRPGFGWSDNAPSPLSAGTAVDALSVALETAGEHGPWIIVSPGIGAIYSRIFSARHGSAVSGLLLIDPLHEDYLGKVASSRKGFFLWLYGVISPLGIERIPGALFRGRNREDRVYGRSAYQGGKYIKAKLQENLVADSLTHNEVASARLIQSAKTPLAIVSSGKAIKKDSGWSEKQKDLTKLTDNLVAWEIAADAPHEVWQTYAGRKLIEKTLRVLVKAA